LDTASLKDRFWRLKGMLSHAVQRCVRHVGEWPGKALLQLLMAAERLNRRYSVHGNCAFFQPDDFPWVRQVVARTAEIQSELDALLLELDKLPNFQDILPGQTPLTTDSRWKSFFFSAYGADFTKNRLRCPRTAQALNLIPGMTTAFFSILAPGKVLPSHRGPYNGVLRFHLGLRIPTIDQSCAIRVDGITKQWAEGDALIFDDSYEHDAWNLTQHWRIVLFVDFLRPLPLLVHLLNKAMVAFIRRTAFIQFAVKNHSRWEATFY